MTSYCYHSEIEAGACTKCGTAITVTEGFTVRVSFDATADTGGGSGFIATTQTPTARDALALVLGVGVDAVEVHDAASEGEYWDRAMRVVWTLKGSRAEVRSIVRVSAHTRKDPDHTEVDEDGQPVVAEATTA